MDSFSIVLLHAYHMLLVFLNFWCTTHYNVLQNPENKREVFCDERLKSIFDGKDKVRFQEITRLLSSHFVKSG